MTSTAARPGQPLWNSIQGGLPAVLLSLLFSACAVPGVGDEEPTQTVSSEDTPPADRCPDLDGDGFCAEDDCDDSSAFIHPDATESCQGGLDEDCDGAIDCWDADCMGSSDCMAECGNGVLEPGEECDDGNGTVGDGCSECLDELEAQAANEVFEAPGDLGKGMYDAANATNGVYGGGAGQGSTDTFSLGYQDGVDNFLVLGWPDRWALNGPGADLAVFENPFDYGNQGLRFMDQIVVYVSQDMENWVVFPHDYLAEDEQQYSADPLLWQGFAGLEPVLLNADSNPVDPFDPLQAGGDHFDLDDLPDDDPEAVAIKTEGFRFIKLVTAPTVINPDTGEPFVHDLVANGADIDGAFARYLIADPGL